MYTLLSRNAQEGRSLQLSASSRQRRETYSPEIHEKYNEAVKRFNDNTGQAKAESAPKGGVGVAASMIVLEPEAEGSKIVAHTVAPL